MIYAMFRDMAGAIQRFVFSVALLSFFFSCAMAQTDTIVPIDKNPERLLKRIDVRTLTNHGFNFWYDDFTGHWAGVDFGFNMFAHSDYTGYDSEFMKNDVLRSNTTYINLIQQSIGLQRNRNTIGLVTGLGLSLQSYRLDRNTTIQISDENRIEPWTPVFDKNQKSKFSIVSVTMPLLAEFQIPVRHYKNRMYLSAGLYGAARLSSHTKIKYRIERKKEKLKTPGHYYLRDVKYGVMFRAGYRWFNVFATWDLVPLFQEDKGPELTPVTVGVTLIRF